MDTQEVIDIFNKFVIANYSRLPRSIVKGQGSWLWDADGNKILDLFPGWAVSGIGHCHPKVVKAIQAQAEQLLHIDNTFYVESQGRLAKLLSERAFGGQCFFCNSGAEANEAALKLARIATAQGKYKFITAEGSFHGRTFATATATGQPQKSRGFLPLLPGFSYIPFNDVNALKEAFTDEVCAVMIEPIQGEGGINMASQEFMQTIRRLCDDNGALMILDEVQTGIGRTGKWFGYQHYQIEPDIITMAKSLGGGVPIGAMMAKTEIAAKLVPGLHASTFGGNPLVTAAAIAVIEAIEEENMLDNVNMINSYICGKLEQLKEKYPIIEQVRGRGVMVGIVLCCEGGQIVSKCLERGLRINCTQQRIIRFMPAMNVSKEEIDKAVEILDGVLNDM